MDTPSRYRQTVMRYRRYCPDADITPYWESGHMLHMPESEELPDSGDEIDFCTRIDCNREKDALVISCIDKTGKVLSKKKIKDKVEKQKTTEVHV